MKAGDYLRIPESVDDIAQLRREAVPLDRHTSPEWLELPDIDYYRYLGAVSLKNLSASDIRTLHAEIEEFQCAELLVSESDSHPHELRLYITAKPMYDNWAIGIFCGESPTALHGSAAGPEPVLSRHDVSDVEAVFVADPFMLEQEGRWYMFFEILNWRSNKGEIGMATSPDGTHWSYQQRVLVEPFHMSYPYVFMVDDEIYMLPETRQSGAVRLYRASSFPETWTLCGEVLEGENLVDCSVFFADNRWWLLAAQISSDKRDSMRLFFTDRIESPWREHPQSPFFAASTKFVRPAGRVLVIGDKILRFAQNQEGAYGTCVRAYEITVLSRKRYAEAPATSIPVLGPTTLPWARTGMHHIDAHMTGDKSWIACVDGRS